ncbi:MAG: zinc ribbon domain-containing protein [Phycisphaerales bacterium]|nr:zinc ribbon domain-containing protein [Phycisphaerales bacterium]
MFFVWTNVPVLFYGLGVLVVLMVLFTTAARSPRRMCPRCRELNRPGASFCAQCGQPLGR